jgi:nitroreductase/kynurenine formamidase
VLIDMTLRVTPELAANAQTQEPLARVGHLGTHFDVMNKEFPLAYTERDAVVFNVSDVGDREIGISDVNLASVEPGMFVAFFTGFGEIYPYGSPEYSAMHPQLADELIDALLARQIAIIGIDFAGIRRGREHTPKDQYCADRGVFIVENLCNLRDVQASSGRFTASTYPMNYAGMTGLPCRVLARFELRAAITNPGGEHMEFFETVEKRYSYRGEFLDTPVPREDLVKIVTAGIRAPSAGNLQSQSFLVITEPEMRARITEIFPHKGIATAPALILLVSSYKELGHRKVSFELKDYGAAAENVLLAIAALGYASVWTDGETSLNQERQAKLTDLLGLPEGHTVRAILPVGVAKTPGSQAARKPFDELVKFERYTLE